MSIAHITLATRDVKRTARFFAETLLWRPIERPNNIPFPATWLQVGPGQECHLIEVADFAPSPFEREYGRHIAVTFPGNGFDALKDRLRHGGAEVIAPLRAGSVERFFFRDPNGYIIEVIAE
jgi:catechol 2,3-dioxygenase-like lactoylglutathione lyase family enzyme